MEKVVRIHAPDGEPLGHIGSQGEGPGEFLTPIQMGFRDGELWVWDLRARRVSWFDARGAFLRDEAYVPRTAPEGAPRVDFPDGVLPDGSFFGSEVIMAAEAIQGTSVRPWFRLRPDGTVIDTMAMVPQGGGVMVLEGGNRPYYTFQPFADSPLFSISPDRMEVVLVDRAIRDDDARFRVTKVAIAADTLWSRQYAFDPVVIEDTAVDSAVDLRAEQAARSGALTRREAESELRDKLFRPSHYPAVRRVRVERAGFVWLELNDPDASTARWRVLDPRGDIIGDVFLPERFSVLNARGDEVWGIYLDDLDVPYIVRYLIRPATPLETADS